MAIFINRRERIPGWGLSSSRSRPRLIMTLANSRDKETQAIWGIKDFQKRFSRFPEGMWLPEAAVDIETLEILAALGIKFTILAPHQARRVKEMGHGEWRDVSG